MKSESRQPKSSKVAIILSGLFPGAGQVYAEDLAKGIAFFVVSIILDTALMEEGYWDIVRGQVELTLNLYGRLIVIVLFRIGVIVDADRTVKRRNVAAGFSSSHAN